jgi:hypothetical protein
MVATSARAWPMRRSAGPEGAGGGAEQVQCADDLVTQPHRHGFDGAEPGLDGGGEPRPALIRPGEIGGADALAGAKAVQARSLVVLDLEQLHQAGCLAGCRRDPQRIAGAGPR